MSHELRMERLFDAPPDVVFDAFVDPDAQREMFDDMVPGWRVLECDVDLRVGGTWTFAFGPPDGQPDRVTGVFSVVDRPHRVVLRESAFISEWGRTVDTTLDVTFEDQDGKTMLRILQTGFETEQDRDGLESGWPMVLEALQKVVSSRVAG